MGVLADIYSGGNTLKRRLNALIQDPAGTLGLGVERFGEDQNQLLNLMRNAYPMAGDRTVLNSPEQIATFRSQLADKGAEQAMAGMFVGPGSKTWDAVSAQKAQALEAAGTDARKIWSETGTWKGPDGKWRQEIPDNTSKLTLGNKTQDAYGAQEANLFSAVKHGNLKRAYPELDATKMLHYPSEGYSGANFDPSDNLITMGHSAMDNKSGAAQHEIQHLIQENEGWAKGGSTRAMSNEILKLRQLNDKFNGAFTEFMNPIDDIQKGNARQTMDYLQKQIQPLRDLRGVLHPDEAYARLAGEAEARATQARMPLDAAQRRALFPEDSYDVPINQLIIRGLLK